MPPDTPPGLADAIEVGDVEEVSIWNVRALALTLHGEGKRNAFIDMGNFLRDYYIRYSRQSGMTEQDDMENWNSASRGVLSWGGGEFPGWPRRRDEKPCPTLKVQHMGRS
jgi:hypothetical protein